MFKLDTDCSIIEVVCESASTKLVGAVILLYVFMATTVLSQKQNQRNCFIHRVHAGIKAMMSVRHGAVVCLPIHMGGLCDSVMTITKMLQCGATALQTQSHSSAPGITLQQTSVPSSTITFLL